jgi:hypothetical protein
VADSLPKVIAAIGPSVFKDYFILVDEIDSFQLDSTYRKSMDLVLDLYKKFPALKRAMLSATKIDFTDPVLGKEPVVSVRYNSTNQRIVELLTTDYKSLHGVVIDQIKKTIEKHPNEKIFIAYNSVKGSLDLAEHLIKDKIATNSEVRILCSQASANTAGKYYHELDSDKLPVKINFFTSAYFTGFDLNEKYHLISVSSSQRSSLALSDRRLKQIAGRSRLGLFSETIIHDYKLLASDEVVTKEELLVASQNQADSILCTKKHYSRSPVLKKMLEGFTSKILNFLEEKKMRFIREDAEGNIVCSYLNIDAHLEAQRVRKELYQNHEALKIQLENTGNKVNQTLLHSDTDVPKSSLSQVDRNNQILNAISLISKSTSALDIDNHLKYTKLTTLEKIILKEYRKIYKFVEKDQMLDLVKSRLLDKTDIRKFKTLMQSAEFYVRPNSDMVVSFFNQNFPIQDKGKTGMKKEKLNKQQIVMRMQMFLTQIGVPVSELTEVSAVRLLKSLRKIYKKSENGNIVYTITGSNPLKIPVVKQRSKLNAEDVFAANFNY